MAWLAVSLALASAHDPPSAPLAWWTGRLVTLPNVHLGVRPAAFLDNEDHGQLECGAAVTVQLSTRAL